MPLLREVQTTFVDAMLGRDSAPAAEYIAVDGLLPEARLQIYRHHLVSSLTAALQATYPVVARLVGDGFFRYAAHEFIGARPPAGPCLFEYGEGLGGATNDDAHLTADKVGSAASSLSRALISDISVLGCRSRTGRRPVPASRVEAALKRVVELPVTAGQVVIRQGDVADRFYIIESGTFTVIQVPALGDQPVVLRHLGPDDTEELTFRFDPSVSFVASSWSIDTIWHANQPDADSDRTIDLDAGGVRLEIRRVGDDVVFRGLEPAAYAFRRSLLAGCSLAGALTTAQAEDEAFDVTEALRALFEDNVLSGFRLAHDRKGNSS